MTTSAYDYPQLPARTRQPARVGSRAATAVCAVCLVLAGLVLLPGLAGYERYVITSGSMSGTYDRGSVVFDRVVPVSELRIGDVITYTPPAGAGPDGLLTHRIASISTDEFGHPVFRTKGDANNSVDPWTFTLDEPRQARVAFSVPYLGYVLAALGISFVRVILLGLPAVLVAAGILARIRREARAEAA
jgi:signal peptidase I